MRNKVIHACKNITEKMNLLKLCGPQSRLCLVTFRPIVSNIYNSLTTIDTLIWLIWWSRVNATNLGAIGQGFHSWLRQVSWCLIFCFAVFVFVFCVCPKHIFGTQFYNFFCNAHLFSIFNKLQGWWLIIRVKRNGPSIFNMGVFL